MAKLAINGGTPVRTGDMPAYPFYPQDVRDGVMRVLDSNVFCSQVGDEVETFEKTFADYHGVAHGVAVANGTLALQAALAACGVGAADEVIIPVYTFIATASAAVAQNAIPVFVDCEETSLGLDPDELRKKVTDRTKAIMPVHMNGYPCDMDAVMEVAKEHNLYVIEDCSHAHGAVYKGKKVGTIGHIGCFSCQHKKNMSLGEGGISVTDDEKLAKGMLDYRYFTFSKMINNFRMSEFHGAIGTAMTATIDEMNAVRAANAKILKERIGDDLPGLSHLPGLPDTQPVYYNYMLRYDPSVTGVPRNDVVNALKAEGIPLNIFYTPLNTHPIFTEQNAFGHGCPFDCPKYGKKLDYANEKYPRAEAACFDGNIEIKIHPPCGEKEMNEIADAVIKVFSNLDELKAASKEEAVTA